MDKLMVCRVESLLDEDILSKVEVSYLLDQFRLDERVNVFIDTEFMFFQSNRDKLEEEYPVLKILNDMDYEFCGEMGDRI
jgi:hypothetical protein